MDYLVKKKGGHGGPLLQECDIPIIRIGYTTPGGPITLKPLAPILLSLILLATATLVIGCDEEPPPSFDPVAWSKPENRDRREKMAKDLIQRKVLLGMTRQQVISLLGGPGKIHKDPEELHYVIGPNVIDDFWLAMRLEDGHVTRAWVKSD